MANTWPLDVLEDGTDPIAMWATPDLDHPSLAIIGVQTEPGTEPFEHTHVGRMSNAREAARRLNFYAEEAIKAVSRVIRWT